MQNFSNTEAEFNWVNPNSFNEIRITKNNIPPSLNLNFKKNVKSRKAKTERTLQKQLFEDSQNSQRKSKTPQALESHVVERNLKFKEDISSNFEDQQTNIDFEPEKFCKPSSNFRKVKRSLTSQKDNIKSEKKSVKSKLDIFTNCETSHKFSTQQDTLSGMTSNLLDKKSSECESFKSKPKNDNKLTSLQENMRTPKRPQKNSYRSLVQPKVDSSKMLDYSEYYDEIKKREHKRSDSSQRSQPRFSKHKRNSKRKKVNGKARIRPKNEYHNSAQKSDTKKSRKMKKTQSSTKISFNGFLKGNKNKKGSKRKRGKTLISKNNNSTDSHGSYISFHSKVKKSDRREKINVRSSYQKMFVSNLNQRKDAEIEEEKFEHNKQKIKNLEIMMKRMQQQNMSDNHF